MKNVIPLTPERRKNAVEKRTHQKAMEAAWEAVATMSDKAPRSVPYPPTPLMLEAGARAGKVSQKTAAKIFAAMVKKAP